MQKQNGEETQDRGKKIKHFDRGFHADVPVDVESLIIHGPPQGILGILDAEIIESVSVWTVDSVKHINKTQVLFVNAATDSYEQPLICADKFGVMSIHHLPSLKVKYNQIGHLSIISDLAFDPIGECMVSAELSF